MENRINRPTLRLIKLQPTCFQALMICVTSGIRTTSMAYTGRGARVTFDRNGRSYEMLVNDMGPVPPGKEPA